MGTKLENTTTPIDLDRPRCVRCLDMAQSERIPLTPVITTPGDADRLDSSRRSAKEVGTCAGTEPGGTERRTAPPISTAAC